LAQFLGDDLGGSVGIEETMADHQAHDLLGAAVVGFGATRLQHQPAGSLALEGL